MTSSANDPIGNKGIFHATLILLAWATTFSTSLSFIHLPRDWAWAIILLPLQTFLNVGLFITAHDAMHRTLAPSMPRLNDALGRVALWCYAFFDFDRLKREHFRHHAEPVREGDPDYHSDERFWPWYGRFMSHYVTWRQWLGMPIAFTVLWLVFRARPFTLLLLWATPALLSSLQLFYFGTYRPHRTPNEGHRDEHRATTSGFSNLWSLLTCYHFGRHWEHHAHPSVPWWKLGSFRPESSPTVDAAPLEESTALPVHELHR